MSVPILLILAAVLFSVGSASLAKSSATIRARRDAWAGRASVTADRALNLTASPEPDLAERRGTRPASLSPFSGRGSVTAESFHAVLAAPWDARDVPFDDEGLFVPHLDPLRKIAGNAIPGLRNLPLGGIRTFARIAGLIRSPAVTGVGGLMKLALLPAEVVMMGASASIGGLNTYLGGPLLEGAGNLVGEVAGEVAGLFGGKKAKKKVKEGVKALAGALKAINAIIDCFGNLVDAANGREGYWDTKGPELFKSLVEKIEGIKL